MSDYGSMLTVKRRNNVQLSSEDLELITSKLEEIDSYNTLQMDYGEGDIKIVDLSEGNRAFILTEHYLDNDDPELYDLVQEEEGELIVQIASELQTILGNEYVVTGSVEDW